MEGARESEEWESVFGVGVFGGGGVSEAVSCGAAGVLSAQDGADECGGGAQCFGA